MPSIHVHNYYSTATDRYANVDVGVLLYHIERYAGIIILTTNLIENIDKAFFRRLKFVLEFDIPPAKLRSQMWKVRLYIVCYCNSDSQCGILLMQLCKATQSKLILRCAASSSTATLSKLFGKADQLLGKGSSIETALK